MLQIGGVLRYPPQGARPADVAVLDGLPNFFYWTHSEDGGTQAQLESGINPMRAVKAADGERRPAVLIRTSPRKAGTRSTPWHDAYDMDGGRVRYFGDAKVSHMPDPRSPKGNRALLRLFGEHSSPDLEVRMRAAPLLFFVTERPGVVQFRGVGLIEGVDLVSQVDPKTGVAFSNYAFDCALVSLADEGERLDWDWITARKDTTCSAEMALGRAPSAWRTWVEEGSESLGRVRRVVARLGVTSVDKQRASAKSVELEVLRTVYDFYSSHGNRRKARFEALAELVADRVITRAHGRYRQGWITRGSGDHGIDFVGRLDVGEGFSSTSLVVLGQAKCEALEGTTSGRDIARTVARLRRGWIGCYVTTGAFSAATQQEVIEDRYPILLIPGLELARSVREIVIKDGVTVHDFLERVDSGYEGRLRDRDPEQVLIL